MHKPAPRCTKPSSSSRLASTEMLAGNSKTASSLSRRRFRLCQAQGSSGRVVGRVRSQGPICARKRARLSAASAVGMGVSLSGTLRMGWKDHTIGTCRTLVTRSFEQVDNPFLFGSRFRTAGSCWLVCRHRGRVGVVRSCRPWSRSTLRLPNEGQIQGSMASAIVRNSASTSPTG